VVESLIRETNESSGRCFGDILKEEYIVVSLDVEPSKTPFSIIGKQLELGHRKMILLTFWG
jgi:hypothetical protein